MGSGPNHRRGHGRVKERGPRYEDFDPRKGCNSTHVARGRRRFFDGLRRAARRAAKREATIESGLALLLPEMADE